MNVFLDTNVLLDVLAEREPFYREAFQLWSLAEQGRVRGLISAISFNNLYYVVRKLAGAQKAVRALRMLRDTFSVVPLDEQTLMQAIDAGFKDFEDAIQFFGALKADAACLITRNPGDYPAGQLPIQTPREFLALHGAALTNPSRET
jgi:predicted nucleic acid-binding protein